MLVTKANTYIINWVDISIFTLQPPQNCVSFLLFTFYNPSTLFGFWLLTPDTGAYI